MLPPRIPRTARAPYTQGLCWSPALGIFVRILDGRLIRSSPLPSSSISYRAYLKIRPWALAHKGRFQRRIKGQDGLPEIAAV